MVSKPSPAVHRTEELVNFLKRFGSAHKFNKWITDMESVLEGNMFAGHHIGKSKIPDYYKKRHGANNLYHYEHREGFGSCYMLVDFDGLGVCPLILDLKDHTEHARIFRHE
jgi:hypothetical protein